MKKKYLCIVTLLILLSLPFYLNEVMAKAFEGPLEPGCPLIYEDQCACEEGVKLSITVYFQGVGKTSSLLAEEINFKESLKRKISDANSNTESCCKHLFLDPKYDRGKDVRENAQIIANEINSMMTDMSEGVTSINLHFIGYSAGGIIAIETSDKILREIESSHGKWCEKELPDRIPVEIDLVTIAAPYGGGGNAVGNWFPKVGKEFCSVLGIDQVLGCSVGSQEYGGISAPSNLCSFTVLVTEEGENGDARAGGPKHRPDPNHLGEGWNPEIISLGEVTHAEAIFEAWRSNQYLFSPNCGCNTQNSEDKEISLQTNNNINIRKSNQIYTDANGCTYPKNGDIKAPILIENKDNTVAAPEFPLFTIVIIVFITSLTIILIRRESFFEN